MSGFLKISGDYSNWNVYRKAVVICDVTEMFINRALPHNSRTVDQMRQAARSCKQNIVEGVSDGTVSAEMCLRLLGVARGSARELLEDYADFLRQRDFKIWSKEDPRTAVTRSYCLNNDDPREFTAKCRERSDETVANIMLTQIRQIDAMLIAVMRKVETEFINEGGIKEAMTRERRKFRGF